MKIKNKPLVFASIFALAGIGLIYAANTVDYGVSNVVTTVSGNVITYGSILALDTTANTATYGAGGTTLYRCTSAGNLRSGEVTTVSADCGSSVDTGIRLP